MSDDEESQEVSRNTTSSTLHKSFVKSLMAMHSSNSSRYEELKKSQSFLNEQILSLVSLLNHFESHTEEIEEILLSDQHDDSKLPFITGMQHIISQMKENNDELLSKVAHEFDGVMSHYIEDDDDDILDDDEDDEILDEDDQVFVDEISDALEDVLVTDEES
jgi:hypothetical protein